MKYALQIPLTSEYWDCIDCLKDENAFRGNRSWLVREEAVSQRGEINFLDSSILLSYGTKGGNVSKKCTYESIRGVYERKNGILLCLSKKRFLFLPITQNKEYNGALADILCLLREKCPIVLRDGNSHIPGIPLRKRISLYFSRTRTSKLIKEPFLLVPAVVLIAFCLFISSVFMYAPLDNREIQRDEAIVITGQYESHSTSYSRGNVRTIGIILTDKEKQFVDGMCATKELDARLSQLHEGTEVTLLIHPSSNKVLEIEAAGEILLDFYTAQSRLTGNATVFFFLGLLLLVCAGYLVYVWFFKRI